MVQQVIFENKQAPGDVLMFTAGIRDLHRQYPGQFVTEMRTSVQSLWEGNPHAQQINPAQPNKIMGAGYSTAINQCNQRAGHFTTGFVRDLSERLGRMIMPLEMRPDVYLTAEEMDPGRKRIARPYWVLVAGGKRDFTAKVWDRIYWQEVINQLREEVYFVQVGSAKHMHPPLTGVTNLIGKTNFRELMTLIYHAQGVVCPVTCTMHLAAAFNKPCVVIAGGREPWWWEAYTRKTWAMSAVTACPPDFVDHTFLHTIGDLRCCKQRGCWRSGVGEKRMGKNCRAIERGPSQPQPACLRMITPEMVTGSVRRYLHGEPIPVDDIPDWVGKPLHQEPWPRNNQEMMRRSQVLHRPRRVYGARRRGERRRRLCRTVG
jgi:ADP-heptose:LPS heptosyltransferase